MALYTSLFPTSSPLQSLSHPQLYNAGIKWKQDKLSLFTRNPNNRQFFCIVKSLLNNRSSSSISDNGATEPARVLLERLFVQTQRLEEQMGRDPHSPRVAELCLDLGELEADLQAALSALKKKEEDLQDAERKVLSEYNEINRAKDELELREEEIVAARLKQEGLEEELRQANLDLASQAAEIHDLKLRLKERDLEISAARSALSLKETEIMNMNNELVKKSEEAAMAVPELRSKTKLLDEVNEIVKRQETELQELRRSLKQREEELEVSMNMQIVESEKCRVAEANLEKQTMNWLMVQEEIKELAEKTSKHTWDANETIGEISRVKKLLADVRSELVSSQKALASSREKVKDQEAVLQKQIVELEEQRRGVMSYMASLRDAGIEVESERLKFRVAEARIKELERDLTLEKEIVLELQKELDKENSSLEQATLEMSDLQGELVSKNAEFEKTQNLLQVKESELVEARLEIQRLKSEQASFQVVLKEKDLELSSARIMLEEVNQEVAEVRSIMKSKEYQLTLAISKLKEKDEHALTMEHELSDAKLKFTEAETVIKRIVELSNKVVLSLTDEHFVAPGPLDHEGVNFSAFLTEEQADGFRWLAKQLEAELEFTREGLRSKEIEVLAAQRALAMKNEELKMVCQKLDAREKEITKMKDEIIRDREDLKQLSALAQERIGEKSVGELAIEKLQLEAAQLEVEAATSALHKLAKMSGELLNKAGLSIEADYEITVLEQDDAQYRVDSAEYGECPSEVKSEISRLLGLTKRLVEEAGITGGTD